MTTDMEKLVIAGREFNSRLFLGTGKFNSDEVMEQSILASGTEMVTVAMKRIELGQQGRQYAGTLYRHPGIQSSAQHLRRAQCRRSCFCCTDGRRERLSARTG